MTYLVTDNCIKCKYTDCVAVCPVDCFHEGEEMLVIDPDVCIDCGVCVPECPANAIVPEGDTTIEWLEINAKYSKQWPVIAQIKPHPQDAKDYDGMDDKLQKFGIK